MPLSQYSARLAIILASVASPATAENLPVQIDGAYGDWPPSAVIATDPAGDDGSSGIDFTELSIANDGDRLFFRFDTTQEVQGDEGQNLVFAIDSDRNPGTGLAFAGIGAELVWRLGDREGTFHDGGGTTPVEHWEIGLVLAATVSDQQFELALDREAEPSGQSLFPNADFDLVVVDDDNGDTIGPATYEFAAGEQPVVSTPFARDDANHVRVVAYNVENNGLFETGSREDALSRILTASDPDVFLFCEIWDHSAAETETRLEFFLPSSGGESWNAVKLDAGNVIVSRFPILNTWEILPGSRLTAALVDPRPRYDTDLLVIANHWSCCTADDNRQTQADALIAFLRDAKTSGGEIDLAPDTPIIAGGDFNLVGLRRQLETLTTGDIEDNGTWGPDDAPDWDGSEFDVVPNRHPDARLTYTWRRDSSSFYPGKLDYICFTGAAAQLHNNFTIETRTMTPASLAAAGLQPLDTEVASDHAALVADFSLDGGTSGLDLDNESDRTGHIRLRDVTPNPFRKRSVATFEVPAVANGGHYSGSNIVEGAVFDSRGRFVTAVESQTVGAGIHRFEWSGVDGRGHEVAPGIFYLRCQVSGYSASAKMTLLR